MTGLVRKATFLSACGVLIATSAMAFVPSPVTSIVPCGIILVGRSSTNAMDPVGTFTITIKDIAGNPIPNAAIVVDFTSCCNDVRPSVIQHGGVVSEANHKKVDVTANAGGVATITIQGMANKLSPNPATPGHGGCAKITANGVLITDGVNKPQVNVATFDLDGGLGALGVTGSDYSVFLGDLFPTPGTDYRQRADYNHQQDSCNDAVTGADYSKFLSALFAPGGVEATNDPQDAVSCP